ncbi:MAG: hypothetical protein IKC31_02195 [Clostridia bacterium]|nr:hypothetical protein [Clostridia bacterium]
MYSRSKDRPNEAVKVPRHYSGCAFSPTHRVQPIPTPPPTKIPAPSCREEPKERSHTSAEERCEAHPTPPLPIPAASENAHCQDSALPVKGLFGNLGLSFPFSHGIGFDELLILGVMLLLAGSEQESDTLLFLCLLLFCG